MAATALSRTRRLLDADQLAFLVGHRSREPLPLVADRRAERGREVPGVLRPLRGEEHLVRVVYPAHGGDPNHTGDLAVLTGVQRRQGVGEIARASGRGRVCPYVTYSWAAEHIN